MLLISLLNRNISFAALFVNGLFAAVGTSVAIDSFFWGYPVWPEGQVLWFNTILNKSSHWGTSPFLWYFYSAMPRALLFSIVLLPFGFFYDIKKCSLKIIIPAIGFVFLYSFLPHKELRFIIYVFPLLNTVAAAGLETIRNFRFSPSYAKRLLQICFYSHLVVNLIVTCGMLTVSSMNYPGGTALLKLHQLEASTKGICLF